ncbi:MAG: hypothetical protein RL069_1337, partial [Planctomycetota bacterium]
MDRREAYDRKFFRREWLGQTLVATGLFAMLGDAQSIAAALDAELAEQDEQESEAKASAKEITAEMVQQASWISRVELNEVQCEDIAKRLNAKAAAIEALRSTPIDENTPMSMVFQP